MPSKRNIVVVVGRMEDSVADVKVLELSLMKGNCRIVVSVLSVGNDRIAVDIEWRV
jgi:hypothetical protein